MCTLQASKTIIAGGKKQGCLLFCKYLGLLSFSYSSRNCSLGGFPWVQKCVFYNSVKGCSVWQLKRYLGITYQRGTHPSEKWVWRMLTFLSKHKFTFGTSSEDLSVTVERRQADSGLQYQNHSGEVQRKCTTLKDGDSPCLFPCGPTGKSGLGPCWKQWSGVWILEFFYQCVTPYGDGETAEMILGSCGQHPFQVWQAELRRRSTTSAVMLALECSQMGVSLTLKEVPESHWEAWALPAHKCCYVHHK